ncbi:MetQ/NlpA family ABC transporter substrate-binding protein [Phreatobacter stygius]|uniref:Lipoprotein n=1 Tax=Phreatobacter stygius TaxID=1940610 RepID=A0A4D7AVQ1_9HYPH|nr:MetQ/NlpA family ABC transporter substrate-binding protein [Phreatobacter stygius]QCI63871.1 MetQ/NlpA family ABC transporter substrate-binding protein [Phreatobacter stygius]
MKRRTFLLSAAATALSAAAGTGLAAQGSQVLRVGVSAGPYGDILREAAKLAEAEGLKVEIIEFTDWNLPNAALQAGDIDLNNFQHRPYLDAQIKARGYKIVALDPSIVVPAGIYSSKFPSIAAIPNGARIAIPNDPSNAARALFLFQEVGLITLKPGAGAQASVLDVVENPRKITFVELDAAQLARSLADVAAAFVTNNYAFLAGLDQKTALKLEGVDSQWTLVFAAREDRKDDPRIQRYIALYRSAQVKAFVQAKFAGTILPTW